MSSPDRDARARALVDRAWGLPSRAAAAGETLVVVDPSTGDPVAEVRAAGEADVETAVQAGIGEAVGWGRAPPAARAAVLRRLADLIEERAETLALVEALDSGRPYARVLEQDVPLAAATFRFHARAAERLGPRIVAGESPGARAVVELEPVGVVAALTPWNLPLLLASWSLAPALAAGCAVLHKPSEHAPLSALLVGEWLLEAGVPSGAIAVLPGLGRVTGAALAAHPKVDQVDFTGSVAAGREVAAAAGAQLTRVSLELGGKNPLVVLDDADPQHAAGIAAFAAFANAGQACSSGSRAIVEEGVRDSFLSNLVATAERLRVGPALSSTTDVGPLITAGHRDRVQEHIEDARARGARVLTRRDPGAERSGGHYLPPTILVDPPSEATCLLEEVFGPVVTVQTVSGDVEAIALANDTPYGLAAGVLGRRSERRERVAAGLRAGTVWIDGWHRYDPAIPFPARARSGTGVHNGREAFLAHVRPRATWGAERPRGAAREVP